MKNQREIIRNVRSMSVHKLLDLVVYNPFFLTDAYYVEIANTGPENGLCSKLVCTCAARLSMPRRMSLTPAASHTRVPSGSGFILMPTPRAPRATHRALRCP